MAHIVTTVRNQAYHVDTGEDEYIGKVLLDGQIHVIDWKHLAPLAMDTKGHINVGGRYSLIMEGKTYEVFVRRITRANEKNGQTYEISVGGQRFEVKTEDERAKLLAGLIKGSDHSGEATIHAPMPGLVIGVLMEAGSEVKMGQPVIVLEAMKMENDLSSPINGKIKEICVSKGQTVDLGDVLVIISNEREES